MVMENWSFVCKCWQLAKAGWTIDEVDVIELNEAFAAQSLAVIQDLNCDINKVGIEWSGRPICFGS